MLVYGVYNSWSFAKLHELAPTTKHRNMPVNLPVKNMDVFNTFWHDQKHVFNYTMMVVTTCQPSRKCWIIFDASPKRPNLAWCLSMISWTYTSTIDGLLTCINVNMVHKIMQHMSPDCAPHTNKHCSHLLNSKTGYIISVFSPGKLW